MKHISARRTAGAVVSAVALLVTVAGPATAGSSGFSRSSGRIATVDWIEVDDADENVDLPGNTHVGWMEVSESSGGAEIWGYITDYECDPGESPYGGGHGVVAEEEEPAEGKCDFVTERYIKNNDATFTMNRKLTTATLVGTLSVVGGHGDPAAGGTGTPPVDITWTAIGDSYTEKYSGSYSDGTQTYSYSYSFTGTDATVAGRMGPMDFTDDATDESYASMGSYRSMDRYRSR